VNTIWTPGPAPGTERTLLVMLPGARLHPADFARNGFLAALQALGEPVDTIAAGLTSDDYLDGDVATRLHHAVIQPALSRGYRRLWLLGISLGGMGALLYTKAELAHVDGLILLAPFLATRGTIAEVTAAGGLAAWDPGPRPPAHDIERHLLAWLKSWSGPRPHLLLGHGDTDRYADASRLLAAHLAPDRLAIVPGGHDWPTWARLWRHLLPHTTFRDDPAERAT